MLDLPQLAAWLGEHHTRDLFRLETLDRYVSDSDGDEFQRFLDGELEPDRASKAGWLDKLRTDTDAGRRWRRVHIISQPLTDYVRYECEWGYTDNTAAGEDVRILDLTADDGSAHLIQGQVRGDFYMVDGWHVAEMTYDENGRFSGALTWGPESPSAAHCRRIAREAWVLATPFPEWWAAHPEFHRAGASQG